MGSSMNYSAAAGRSSSGDQPSNVTGVTNYNGTSGSALQAKTSKKPLIIVPNYSDYQNLLKLFHQNNSSDAVIVKSPNPLFPWRTFEFFNLSPQTQSVNCVFSCYLVRANWRLSLPLCSIYYTSGIHKARAGERSFTPTSVFPFFTKTKVLIDYFLLIWKVGDIHRIYFHQTNVSVDTCTALFIAQPSTLLVML